MNFKKILAPTDLSELSLIGVRAALELAKTIDAEVIVYYVVCLDEFIRFELSHVKPVLLAKLLQKHRSEVEAILESHLGDVLSSVRVRTVVELGIPENNIVDKAKYEDVDLIVISTHGRTGLSHVFTGSVTESVVRLAPCPVLSIRPEAVKTAVSAAA